LPLDTQPRHEESPGTGRSGARQANARRPQEPHEGLEVVAPDGPIQ
jgi:hypothetical protein